MITFLIFILDFIQTSFTLRFFGVREKRRAGFLESPWKTAPCSKQSVSWFHASSLGELEMVRPLIDDFIKRGERVGVSVFSDSALPGLSDLKAVCVYAGLSPRERNWESLFEHFSVSKLILAKYEFWPGLISVAARRDLPVLVINAKVRASFQWVRRAFRLSFHSLPRFFFFMEPGAPKNVSVMNGIQVLPGVDPRWERIARRLESPSKGDRIRYWKDRISNLPRPLGVLGSAWVSDVERVLPAFSGYAGSLLIVPHSLGSGNLKAIESRIPDSLRTRVVMVSEMGILVELYALADFAFVGGGFAKGIHSTLEPAACGLPVASGPVRVSDFSETEELSERGVFRVCSTPDEVAHWIAELPRTKQDLGLMDEKRIRYRALLEECLRIR